MTLNNIYFSPTGGTFKVSDIICKCLSNEIEEYDLSISNSDYNIILKKDTLSVISMPVFKGRIPSVAIHRLSQIDGNSGFAIIVAVYGNREVEDALIELNDAAKKAGFNVIAAITAIAEHSEVRNVAKNRPDNKDIKAYNDFCNQIENKIKHLDKLKHLISREKLVEDLIIPGNRPYKEIEEGGAFIYTDDICFDCGMCAENCPVTAIDFEDFTKTDASKCINCMRCIDNCPMGARSIDEKQKKFIIDFLSKTAIERKEAKLYI